MGGGAALTVLLIVEADTCGVVVDASNDTLTAVHVPLAMAVLALVVWLPLEAPVAGAPRRDACIDTPPAQHRPNWVVRADHADSGGIDFSASSPLWTSAGK